MTLQTVNAEIFCPSLVLPESSAAIARRSGDEKLAMLTAKLIAGQVGMQLISITKTRAQRAAHIAAHQKLHGADSVYVAIAEEFAATLVTLDSSILQRAGNLVAVTTPADWLLMQQTNSNSPS